MIAGALEPKRLELLHEIVPKATVIHMLVNPNNAGAVQDIPEVALAARGIGLRLQVVPAGTEADIDVAFVKLVREKAQALLVMADGYFTLQRQQIAVLAARHALPAVYPWREHAVAGGLV
jgi:putative ABC transport system substrate-binding protein